MEMVQGPMGALRNVLPEVQPAVPPGVPLRLDLPPAPNVDAQALFTTGIPGSADSSRGPSAKPKTGRKKTPISVRTKKA